MMQPGFTHYWQVIRRWLPQVLLVSAAASVVAYFIVQLLGPTYQVHFSYLISLSDRDDVNEYRFDGYYALQATGLFADTLARWTQTPETVVAAYRQAGLEVVDSDPGQLTRTVSAEQTAPQLVEVTVRQSDAEAARRLADALRVVMQRNVERYHEQGTPALIFRVVASEPWMGKKTLSVPVITVATFVLVFFFGINVVLLLASLARIDNFDD